MSYEEHLTEFAGLPVARFPTDPDQPLPEVEGPCAWHVASFFTEDDWEEAADYEAVFQDFLKRVDTTEVEALIVGAWAETMDEESPVRLVAGVAPRFPKLRALFFGDILREQSDVAYIEQMPLTSIIEAYPDLTELWVRGGGPGSEPLVGPVKHDRLRVLVFQSGGLPATTIRGIGECEFPELEHLEFYFGNPDYGGDGTPDDVAWLLAGSRFPKLRYLGLTDSVIQDEIVAAVAHAPIVAQLETLDLSQGTMTDEGAATLLAGQPLNHLRKLDLHHHFLSEEMAERLAGAWPGVEVDVRDRQQADSWRQRDGSMRTYRYIAINE